MDYTRKFSELLHQVKRGYRISKAQKAEDFKFYEALLNSMNSFNKNVEKFKLNDEEKYKRFSEKQLKKLDSLMRIKAALENDFGNQMFHYAYKGFNKKRFYKDFFFNKKLDKYLYKYEEFGLLAISYWEYPHYFSKNRI